MWKIFRYVGRLWRRKSTDTDLDFFRFLWKSLKVSLIHFWQSIQPALTILKDDLLQTAKQLFKTFQSLIKEIIKKGVKKVIEFLLKRVLQAI